MRWKTPPEFPSQPPWPRGLCQCRDPCHQPWREAGVPCDGQARVLEALEHGPALIFHSSPPPVRTHGAGPVSSRLAGVQAPLRCPALGRDSERKGLAPALGGGRPVGQAEAKKVSQSMTHTWKTIGCWEEGPGACCGSGSRRPLSAH